MAPEVVDKGFLLTSLRHFIDGLELDFARYAAEFDQSKQWDEEGFNNPADWMRFQLPHELPGGLERAGRGRTRGQAEPEHGCPAGGRDRVRPPGDHGSHRRPDGQGLR